jgi:hypothetical protein
MSIQGKIVDDDYHISTNPSSTSISKNPELNGLVFLCRITIEMISKYNEIDIVKQHILLAMAHGNKIIFNFVI